MEKRRAVGPRAQYDNPNESLNPCAFSYLELTNRKTKVPSNKLINCLPRKRWVIWRLKRS